MITRPAARVVAVSIESASRFWNSFPGRITSRQFDEMVRDGWTYCLQWDGSGLLWDAFTDVQWKMPENQIEMPDTVYLAPGVYKREMDATLTAQGVRMVIHHGEDGLFVFEALLRCSAFVFSTEPKWDILERPGSASHTPYSSKWLTAVDAAEEMLALAPDEEVADALMLNVIRRAKLVEKHALLSGGSREDVRKVRAVFRKYSGAFEKRKRTAWQRMGYLLYRELPPPLLRPILRLQDAALARQTTRLKKRGAGRVS